LNPADSESEGLPIGDVDVRWIGFLATGGGVFEDLIDICEDDTTLGCAEDKPAFDCGIERGVGDEILEILDG
jgi:hypothetical protein